MAEFSYLFLYDWRTHLFIGWRLETGSCPHVLEAVCSSLPHSPLHSSPICFLKASSRISISIVHEDRVLNNIIMRETAHFICFILLVKSKSQVLCILKGWRWYKGVTHCMCVVRGHIRMCSPERLTRNIFNQGSYLIVKY